MSLITRKPDVCLRNKKDADHPVNQCSLDCIFVVPCLAKKMSYNSFFIGSFMPLASGCADQTLTPDRFSHAEDDMIDLDLHQLGPSMKIKR